MTEAKHGRISDEKARQFVDLSPADRIQTVLDIKAPEDQRFISLFTEQQCKLRDITWPTPKTMVVTFAFKVDRYYCNASGNMHGGAQAAVFDYLTSVAMQGIGKPDFWINGGVSRTLTVTYLRPAPEGEDLLLECEIVHMGKKLAFLRGALKREKDGAIISMCDHDKAAVPTKPGFKL